MLPLQVLKAGQVVINAFKVSAIIILKLPIHMLTALQARKWA